jgi:hypothetical protein
MQKAVATILVSYVLTACSFSGTYLEPPPSKSESDAITADMDACLSEAREPRELTVQEQMLIAGKDTARLFMNGRLVVNPEGKPALHQSAFPQSSNHMADRYAVCLLKRGYTWAQK